MKHRIAGWVSGLIVTVFLMPAYASEIAEEEFTCPYDGTKFTAVMQASGSSFGSMLDFRPYGAMVTPWPMASCPTNGFVFFKSGFEAAELDRLKPLVLSDDYQALRQETPYYRAAWLRARTGETPAKVTWALLQASWEASEEPERYRRYADEILARLPADIAAETNPEQKFGMELLRVELLRRTGRFAEAGGALENLLPSIPPASIANDIALYQRDLIAKGDPDEHEIPQKDRKPVKP